jgi:cell division protein FtsB
MMAKIKLAELERRLNELNAEIHWRDQQISNSLDYGKTIKLREEIATLKTEQMNLLRRMEEFRKAKDLIKSRSKAKTISVRNGNRTIVM